MRSILRIPLINRLLFLSAFLLISLALLAPSRDAMIRLATLAPQGSNWYKILEEMAKEIETETQHAVVFKIFGNGVLGEEPQVLQKIRMGSIQAGVMTGAAIGEMVPELRVLEIPLLFQNYEEVDWVLENMFERFSAYFEDRGLILLGFAEAGLLYIFSKEPIKKTQDLASIKMWALLNEPITAALCRAYHVNPIPLPITQVESSLRLGRIDAFYASPVAAIAFQWTKSVHYISDQHLAYSIAPLVMGKEKWDHLSPDVRQTIKRISVPAMKKLVSIARKENETVFQSFQNQGIKVATFDPDEFAKVKERSIQIGNELADKLYPLALLEDVRLLLLEYRKNQPNH